jgi:hypothetical protein
VTTETILTTVAEVVPVEVERLGLRRGPKGGLCVLSTRIGIETLRYFRIPARPLVTTAMAANAAWTRWAAAGCPGGADGFPEEAWNVIAGATDDVDVVRGIDRRDLAGFDGHLVIAVDVDSGTLLVDLDAAQFSRPEREIVTPDAVVAEWRDGRGAGLDLDDGGVLIYRPHPRPPSFVHAPDWRLSAKEAGASIRAVRDRLTTPAPDKLGASTTEEERHAQHA